VDEELLFHIEGRIEDFVARGMTREQAEAEARRRFGDLDGYRRQARDIDERLVRDRRRLELLGAFLRETRRAARGLLRTPAFTLIAVVTLALGIGATTAIYTILESIVLRPLPYPEADRLVAVLHPTTVPGTGEMKWGVSSAGYFHFRGESRTLADLGVYHTGDDAVSGDGEAEVVKVGRVTASLLSILGARPAAGRLLLPDDDRPGAAPVVVLGYDFWRRRYGGDPRIVGRTIQLLRGPAQVVGVTARGFSLPKPGAFASARDLAGFRVDLWEPLRLDPSAPAQNSHYLAAIGRLGAGVAVEEAQRDLAALTRRLPERFPRAYSDGFMEEYDFRMRVAPLRDEVLGDRIARSLWVLFGAVGLVLLIACANVANLFLVRMEARRRESAIRAALGADRLDMAVHHLSESLLIALVAGAGGVALATVGLRTVLALAPADIPRLGEVGLRWTAMLVAAAISLGAGILFGLVPALRARLDVASLREGARGSGSSPRRRIRSALVVAQVALALVLLAAAGLMGRSFARLHDVRPGLDPAGVVAFDAVAPPAKYDTPDAALGFHRELHARLAALPGVRAVGAATGLPLRDFGGGCSVVFREGRPYGPDEQVPCVQTPRVTPGFFRALGIEVRGREPAWSDLDANTGAVVVTRALADHLWPGENPIGKGINSNGGERSSYYRVVGVVPELRAVGLDQPPTEMIFYPTRTLPSSWIGGGFWGGTYIVRTSLAAPTSLAAAIRRTVAELEPHAPVAEITSMGAVVERSMARVSFIMTLLAVAAGMALLLSAVGLYGVISYIVGQRRAEIGVRMALGARVGEVARLVVRQAVALAAAGVALGLAGALAGTRVLRSLLFEVSPTDPAVLGAVAALLIAIAALAAFAPARRAARVDPAEALRSE
jgi:predicted permease